MAELQHPAYYKETMKTYRRLRDIINPDLFEDCRIDSGPNPYAPKPISGKNLGMVIKETSQSTNMPPEKWPVDGLNAIDSSVVELVKKHYGFKG